MPKVSVVITAYNAMVYLPETMQSVLQQTFSDFEVVLVNNGSTDHIVEWVSLLNEPRIKLFSQKNRGIPGGLNRGIAEAQGEYIAFLDADDLWDSTKLEKQVSILDEHPEVGLVYSWFALIDKRSEDMRGLLSNQTLVKYAIEGDVSRQILEQNFIGCGSSAMVRRACIDAVGMFDSNFTSAADWDMWVRLALRYPFKVICEPLTYYRKHSNSMTSNWQAAIDDCGVAIEKIFSYVPAKLQYLKGRSYGLLFMYHAEQRLRSKERNHQEALRLYKIALKYYPMLNKSTRSLRLLLTIQLLRWLGTQNYDQILGLLHMLRRPNLTRRTAVTKI